MAILVGDHKNKLIWAVDPSQDPEEAKKIIKEIKAWAKRLRCEVLPVSVISTSRFNYPMEMAFQYKESFESLARRYVDGYLKKCNAKGFLNSELIFVKTFSSRQMAYDLAKFAEKTNGLMIFANTRAKKTWNPFRLGGFAETLAASSRVPVLLLNSSATPTNQIPAVLFPTDFGKESKAALMQLVPWVKAFRSKVLLYNQVETANMIVADFNGAPGILEVDTEKMMKSAEKLRLKKAQEWTAELKEHNISCFSTVRREKKLLATEIIELAKKNKIDLIAMASHAGPVEQAILGSIARDVLLQAKCPVLIFHRPKVERKSGKNSKYATPRKSVPKNLVVQVSRNPS